MMRTNKKLFDQIFELKYLCKQLNQHSNKCEQEEKAQKKKAKAALEKGNMEGAKIHASNAIRKKGEALNYLKLASRLDAVISRLDQQNTLSQVNKSATGITKNINRLLSSVPTEKMASNMGEFTQALENLDVATASMDDAMNKQAASMHDDAAATELLQQLADENDMNLKIAAPGAVTTQLTSENEGKEEEEGEDLMTRLNQLRALNDYICIHSCVNNNNSNSKSDGGDKDVGGSSTGARKIENELDMKLAAFGKLCSRYEYGYTGGESGISAATSLSMASSEIESLIAQLTTLNSHMSVQETSESRAHIVARHKDILHDYSQEYKRLGNIAAASRNRADLLGLSGGQVSSGIISRAYGVSSSLGQQRQLFDSIDSRLAMLGAKYPVMNSVLNAIRRRKNRDNVILTG
eukprot:jgi/Picre1/31175/NNA_006529.t1